jgi:hypothetical protein
MRVGQPYGSSDVRVATATVDVQLDNGELAKAQVVLAVQSQVAPVNRSGDITEGGVTQELMPANTGRQGFILQNNSSGALYISSVGAPAPDGHSLKIGPGQLYVSDYVSGNAIGIYGATTGQQFFCREW